MPDGRQVGRTHEGKRREPEPIPDRRIKLLDRFIPLSRKSVLEVGCFEGLHTIGLRQFTTNVTAIDVRPVNVFKTLARLSLYGADAKVFIADCETIDSSFGSFDVIFHVGVLYHLMDPVAHLLRLGDMTEALYLDTHVAAPDAALMSYEVEHEGYQFTPALEGGWQDPFSGAHPTARHLALESLQRALAAAGLAQQRIVQVRDERNGPRVLILAAKTLDLAHVPEAPADQISALKAA